MNCWTAVVFPLCEVGDGRWAIDRTVALPVLVPLGCRAAATANGAGA